MNRIHSSVILSCIALAAISVPLAFAQQPKASSQKPSQPKAVQPTSKGPSEAEFYNYKDPVGRFVIEEHAYIFDPTQADQSNAELRVTDPQRWAGQSRASRVFVIQDTKTKREYLVIGDRSPVELAR